MGGGREAPVDLELSAFVCEWMALEVLVLLCMSEWVCA